MLKAVQETGVVLDANVTLSGPLARLLYPPRTRLCFHREKGKAKRTVDKSLTNF